MASLHQWPDSILMSPYSAILDYSINVDFLSVFLNDDDQSGLKDSLLSLVSCYSHTLIKVEIRL